jgi:hypothetical protein
MQAKVKIDGDIYATVKTLAKSKGVRPDALIGQLLRRTLPKQAPAFELEHDLPILQVKPNARTIPGDRAQKLLSND